MGTDIQNSTDSLTSSISRQTFSFNTSGAHALLTSGRPAAPAQTEVIEVAIEAVGANTVQLQIGGVNITPAWDLDVRQTYVDPGFLLLSSDTLDLVTGGTGLVIGYVRFRTWTRL